MTLTHLTPLTVRGHASDPTLWYQEGQTVSLGCSVCPELRVCGGLSTEAQMHSCLSLCCNSPDTCESYACPNQRRYSGLINEVGGLDLRPYRARVMPAPILPEYVPCILDGGDLVGPLAISTVAISLYSIVNMRTGLARYSSRQALLERFKINPDARLIICATGKDRHVERFWASLNPKQTAQSLRRLRPALIATPNFSMHVDTVRHDNLLSMARIAACFEEFASAGMPVALHVNGRTTHDFSRWTEYLRASPSVHTISYELGTAAKSAKRRLWHTQQLIAMANRVARPLHLLIRGGSSYHREFASAFERVTVLDSTALMKAKYRQSAKRVHNRVVWLAAPTRIGQAIDQLLLHNIRVCRSSIHAASHFSHISSGQHTQPFEREGVRGQFNPEPSLANRRPLTATPQARGRTADEDQ